MSTGKLTKRLAILSFGVCMAGNFQQAYLLSVLNQPYIEIRSFINDSIVERTGRPMQQTLFDFIWALLNVTNPIAAIFGQLIALWCCNKFGRKNASIFSCILAIPGIALSLVAKWAFPYYELLFVGRFIWGVANGIITITQTVWIIESAPVSQRGRVSSWQETIATLGNLATQAIGIPFSTATLWPLMFVVPFIINLLCMATFWVMHESPQYLLFFKNDKEKAKAAISAYHGITDEAQLIEELARLERNGQVTKKPIDEESKPEEVVRKNTGMDVMFRPWKANDAYSIVVRQGAWVGVMVKIAYVFSGARCIRSYNTFLYHELGGWPANAAQYGSLANSLIRLPLSIIPIFLVERVGRRSLLLVSIVVSFASLLLTFISMLVGPAMRIGTLLGIAFLLFATSMGLGSLSRFYAAELVPRKLLLKTMTVLAMIEALIKIIIEFSFYPLATAVRGYSMLIFLIPTAIFTVLIYWLCPETKGRSVNTVLNGIAAKRKVAVSFQRSLQLREK